jgi:pimeloyl-ACP methyl ester carboxylesterase
VFYVSAARTRDVKTDELGSGDDLLFVMGWGNRVDGTNERWFATQLVEAGYRVTLVELPTNPTDFEREYLAPVADVRDGLDSPVVVGHSTGGLVAAHLQPERVVYVSPWWAFYGEKIRGSLLEWGSKLPIETPVVPIDFDREEVGPRVTDRGWERVPDRVSPAFVREIRRAQAELPPIADGARVCVSLSDTVVGLQGVGERVPPERVHLYEGRHEPFTAEDRTAATAVVVDALDATESDGNV